MSRLDDILARKHGAYRAHFGDRDLGELASPPEIRTDCEIVKMTIHNDNLMSGYDEIGNTPLLFGNASLHLFAVDSVWKFIAGNSGSAGELTLQPGRLSDCGKLIFPVAELLPRWEFEPTGSYAHTICIHFNLKSDASGKIFYYI